MRKNKSKGHSKKWKLQVFFIAWSFHFLLYPLLSPSPAMARSADYILLLKENQRTFYEEIQFIHSKSTS